MQVPSFSYRKRIHLTLKKKRKKEKETPQPHSEETKAHRRLNVCGMNWELHREENNHKSKWRLRLLFQTKSFPNSVYLFELPGPNKYTWTLKATCKITPFISILQRTLADYFMLNIWGKVIGKDKIQIIIIIMIMTTTTETVLQRIESQQEQTCSLVPEETDSNIK